MNIALDGFLNSCRRHPNNIAFVIDEHEISYTEFLSHVVAISATLSELKDESHIGILTGGDVHTYASIYAVWLAGKSYVPLNEKNSALRHSEIIDDAGLKTVLCSREDDKLIQANDEYCDESLHIIHSHAISPVETDPATLRYDTPDLAYIFFTSGSTGKPKGVPVSISNLNAFLEYCIDQNNYHFGSSDRFLQMFELTFDLSVFSFACPLCIAATCCVVPSDGMTFINVATVLEEQHVTVALMVPSTITFLRNYFDEIELPDLRYSMFCGEALLDEVTREWSDCLSNDCIIQNVYGPTEATIFCSIYDWHSEASRDEAVNGVVSIGKPFTTTGFTIVDADNNELPAGEKGELCLSGPQVTMHYWNNPEKTSEAYFDHGKDHVHMYKTGDLVYSNDNGNYIYCGRTDSQVKVNGFRIELGEVEHLLRKYFTDCQCAVVAIQNTDLSTELHLFLDAEIEDRKAYQKYKSGNLLPYMQPTHVHIVQSMPLNQNGKVDRKALAALV